MGSLARYSGSGKEAKFFLLVPSHVATEPKGLETSSVRQKNSDFSDLTTQNENLGCDGKVLRWRGLIKSSENLNLVVSSS